MRQFDKSDFELSSASGFTKLSLNWSYDGINNEPNIVLSCSNFNYLLGGKRRTGKERWNRMRKEKGSCGGGCGGVSVKCERSYISLISHPSYSNLLIKQVLQEVKRCVSRPHEDRWHPSARFERDKREWAQEIKEKGGYLNWSTQKRQQQGDRGDCGLLKSTKRKEVQFFPPPTAC